MGKMDIPKVPFGQGPSIPKNEESDQARNARYVAGDLTDQEIKNYWNNPEDPLFSHELVVKTRDGQERKTKFNLRALTEKYVDDLVAETETAWDPLSFEEYNWTLKDFWKPYIQTDPKNRPDIPIEYYTVTDENDRPFGMAGLYSEDLKGIRGFKTRDQLDSKKHNMIVSGGWGVMSAKKEHRLSGIGSRFLFPWAEKLAKSRGADIMTINCYEGDKLATARSLYEKGGYAQGFNVKDYFGPGRDLFTYYENIADKRDAIQEYRSEETITEQNLSEVLTLAQQIYLPERAEELKLCVDLLLEQAKKQRPGVLEGLVPESFVIRDDDGKVKSFSILGPAPLNYNSVEVFFAGSRQDDVEAKKDLLEKIKGYTKAQSFPTERNVIIFGREGEDQDLLAHGFISAADGIPEAAEKGNLHKFLMYTKKLHEQPLGFEMIQKKEEEWERRRNQ
jgi:hypothetical protein